MRLRHSARLMQSSLYAVRTPSTPFMQATSSSRDETTLAGGVAKALDIGVQTLHFYEREGLIPPPRRSESGYRLYTPALIERVRFIKKAQALGLPLGEIKEILNLAARGSSPCGRVQAALAAKLVEVDERLEELRSFRDELATLVGQASRRSSNASGAQVCGIVEKATPLRMVPHAKPLPRRRGGTR